MMEETGIRVMKLRGEGWCCAQIVVLLILEDLGRESPDLVRAARSLCFGLGDLDGPCGALTGGCLALGLVAGGRAGDETVDERLRPLLTDLNEWFRKTMESRHGGITCGTIVGPGSEAPNPSHCGPAIIETYETVLRLLADHDIDSSQYA